MNASQLRAQLHKHIDNLPDDIIEQIADFTLFVMDKKHIHPEYEEWDGQQWQDFALEQFFREDDEVEYSLQDAQEIYHLP
jgi:hypothetical protein